MPFNGSGVFTRLYSWIADAAGGIDITASRMDGDTNDIVSNGLGNCLTRDGQGQPVANLPMNNFRHTGASAAVGSGDYVTLGQTTSPGLAALTVTGATTVGGTLGVTGATTVGGTLGVTGAATFTGNATVDGITYFGTSGSFSAGPNGANSLLNFAGSQYIQYVPGTGFTFSSTGSINLSCSLAEVNGTQIVTNSGTWGISITGNAATATTATTAAYANGSSGSFACGTYMTVSGALALGLDSYYFTNTSGGLIAGSWSAGIAVNCSAGGVTASGFFTNSDARVKTEIEDITPEQGVSWIKRGRPKRFQMDGKLRAGFIAQEDVDSGRGEAVIYAPSDDPRVAVSDGYAPDGHRLVRDYEHDIAYLTAALQHAMDRIAILEGNP